jgi:hypothetical protein
MCGMTTDREMTSVAMAEMLLMLGGRCNSALLLRVLISNSFMATGPAARNWSIRRALVHRIMAYRIWQHSKYVFEVDMVFEVDII